ncbi:MAG: integrase core domain-containing protein [Bacilli bacterium]|nr:integrase core domain-containing protein [Bacilli bacterium]
MIDMDYQNKIFGKELLKAVVEYINYYNLERMTERTKGLPPVLHRRQSLNQLSR